MGRVCDAIHPFARGKDSGSARGGEAYAKRAALSSRSPGGLLAVATGRGSGSDGSGSRNQFAHRARPGDVVLPGSAVRVLRQETGSSPSAPERGRAELLRARESAFRSSAGETPHRYSV